MVLNVWRKFFVITYVLCKGVITFWNAYSVEGWGKKRRKEMHTEMQ